MFETLLPTQTNIITSLCRLQYDWFIMFDCRRSDTPLIYRAVPSWFVQVESIVDKLLASNAQTYWLAHHQLWFLCFRQFNSLLRRYYSDCHYVVVLYNCIFVHFLSVPVSSLTLDIDIIGLVVTSCSSFWGGLFWGWMTTTTCAVSVAGCHLL